MEARREVPEWRVQGKEDAEAFAVWTRRETERTRLMPGHTGTAISRGTSADPPKGVSARVPRQPETDV